MKHISILILILLTACAGTRTEDRKSYSFQVIDKNSFNLGAASAYLAILEKSIEYDSLSQFVAELEELEYVDGMDRISFRIGATSAIMVLLDRMCDIEDMKTVDDFCDCAYYYMNQAAMKEANIIAVPR